MELEDLLNKYNINQAELTQILKQSQKPKLRKDKTHSTHSPTEHIKYGLISDLHIGHKCFRPDVFEDSIKQFKTESVDSILCCGDIIEGMSNRDGHVYELTHIGVSNQLQYAIQILQQYQQPLQFILGNHDLFSMKKGNQGINIGTELQEHVTNSQYLGDMRTDININDKVTIRLTHEGNSAYALSYSTQKRVNAMEGGHKPHILLNGHLHKAIYMFYRNIHCLESATLESQTDFMAEKGSPAHVGFYVLDLKFNKQGITEFIPKFYPYY